MTDMCRVWDDFALQYLAKGYSVIPLAPKQKGPKLSGWSVFCSKQMDPAFALSFNNKGNNMGLCLGEASGVMAVDVDTEKVELLAKIEKIIPLSPVRKRGAKGYTAFYKYEGQISQSFKKGDDGIDILCHGRQTVMPGSVHPSGAVYHWITPKTLLDIQKKDLPSITETTIAQLRTLFKTTEKKPLVRSQRKIYKDAVLEEIREALRVLDPDESYEQWVNVGLALRAELGENGFDLFNGWSARGEKYDGVGPCYKKYKSFENVREITIATLFHYAIENGYESKQTWDADDLVGDTKQQKETWDTVASFLGLSEEQTFYDESVMFNPPGFLGTVCKWLTKVSPVIQPIYVLSAGVSFIGAVYAHKFKCAGGARSNIYTLCVGPSGSGKSRIADIIPWLMLQLPQSYSSMLLGEPKSDAGLIDGIVDRNGKALLCIDEIGCFLRGIKATNASVYAANIGAEFTKLFSRANGVFMSAAYSQNGSKKKSFSIEEPCLVIFGQSVKQKVFDQLTEEDFVDGFFTRWILFESTEKMPAINTDYVDKEVCYPHEIIDFCTSMDQWVIDAKLTNNLNKTIKGVNALIVPMTTAAKELQAKYALHIQARRAELDEDDVFDYSLARANEHLDKLALCACEFIDERPVITDKSVEWAIAVMECHFKQVKEKMSTLSTSEYELLVQRLIRNIPINVRMSKVTFNNCAKFIPFRQRKDILEDLLSRKVLEWDKDEDGKVALIRRKK